MTSQRTRERLIARLRDQGIEDETILTVIASTPRHLFLDEALSHRAYEDSSLPIGHGQTLSRPYIVARMTEVLRNRSQRPLRRVLEIGTGSGYQAAVLAQLVEQVFTVERIKPLQNTARTRLRQLALHNVHFKHSDGGFGWPDKGPYDAIISTAAPRQVPDELLNQLAQDALLVIPLGDREQQLCLFQRQGDSGEFSRTALEPVHFVPLLSGTTR